MERNKTGKPEDQLVDNLLKEAFAILHSSEDLNKDREKLTGILDQFVYWTNEKNYLQEYFDEFQKIICSMATLDFSSRMTLNPSLKTFQNLISISLNALNEELDEKVFPKSLVNIFLDKLELKNTIVIQVDKNGCIRMFHTDLQQMFPDKSLFEGKAIGTFIDNIDELEKDIATYGTEAPFKAKLKSGYTGEVTLKIAVNQFYKYSEGAVFIIQIPEL